MSNPRTLARASLCILSSMLLGCSTTTRTPGSSDGEVAGAAGTGTAHATNQGGEVAGVAGTVSANPTNLAGQAAQTGGAGTGGVAGASTLTASSSGTNGFFAGGAGHGGTSFNGADPPGGGQQNVAGGGTSTANPQSFGGSAGAGSGTAPCSVDSDCSRPNSICQKAVCSAATCAIVNLGPGESCGTGKVCSGTGTCGECVPAKGKCEGRVPSLCNTLGAWVTGTACGLGDQCMDGRCISATVGWSLPITGDTNAEIEDLSFLEPGAVLVAGFAEPGSVIADTQTIVTSSPGTSSFVLSASRLTGKTSWSLPIAATGWTNGSRIGVASNTSFVHGFRYQGTIGTYANPNSNNFGGFLRGYNAARAMQFTQRFDPIDDTVEPMFDALDAILAQPTGTFVMYTYSTAIRYSTTELPGYGTLSESNSECATVLSYLNASGDPQWNKQFAWCTDNNRKVLKLGPTGDLYIAGAGCRQNGFGPAPILDSTTLTSAHSGVIARLRPTDGSVLKTVEFKATTTSYGRVDDMAFLPDGSIAALVSANSIYTMMIGATEVPPGTYLVKLDGDLNLLGFQPLGTAVASDARVTGARLAVAPNGVLYVAGTFIQDFDFGGGTLAYHGSCVRCPSGDAFVASYTPNFTHRWSRAISSTSYDYATAILAENGRAYASVVYGATIMVDGTPYAPAASYVRASAVFAFVE